MLDLHRLRILVAVAEHGSLRGAADSLSYTRAAISQQIGVLERELGTAVIERHARGVVLTEVGKTLAGRGEDLLRRLNDIEAEVEAIGRLEAGSLKLGAFASAIAGIIPRAFDMLRQRFPGLELVLVQGEPDDLVPRLLRRELNLALVFHADDDRRLENQGVELIPLLEDPMLVALSRRHPLAGRASLRFADFRDEAWIQGTSGDCFDILRRACWAAGFEPRVPFDCDSFRLRPEARRRGARGGTRARHGVTGGETGGLPKDARTRDATAPRLRGRRRRRLQDSRNDRGLQRPSRGRGCLSGATRGGPP
jgi:DNA-binding transcriptional LysR family regulator